MTLDCSSQTHFPCLVDGQGFGDQAVEPTHDFGGRLGAVHTRVASLFPRFEPGLLFHPTGKNYEPDDSGDAESPVQPLVAVIAGSVASENPRSACEIRFCLAGPRTIAPEITPVLVLLGHPAILAAGARRSRRGGERGDSRGWRRVRCCDRTAPPRLTPHALGGVVRTRVRHVGILLEVAPSSARVIVSETSRLAAAVEAERLARGQARVAAHRISEERAAVAGKAVRARPVGRGADILHPRGVEALTGRVHACRWRKRRRAHRRGRHRGHRCGRHRGRRRAIVATAAAAAHLVRIEVTVVVVAARGRVGVIVFAPVAVRVDGAAVRVGAREHTVQAQCDEKRAHGDVQRARQWRAGPSTGCRAQALAGFVTVIMDSPAAAKGTFRGPGAV